MVSVYQVSAAAYLSPPCHHKQPLTRLCCPAQTVPTICTVHTAFLRGVPIAQICLILGTLVCPAANTVKRRVLICTALNFRSAAHLPPSLTPGHYQYTPSLKYFLSCTIEKPKARLLLQYLKPFLNHFNEGHHNFHKFH